MEDKTKKLAELERRNRDEMVAVVFNGRKVGETIGLRLAAESLSCAIMSSHRARMNSGMIPKRLRKRIERVHALLISVTTDITSELTKAITRKT